MLGSVLGDDEMSNVIGDFDSRHDGLDFGKFVLGSKDLGVISKML